LLEEKSQVYEFDEFRLDVARRRLLRGGEVVPIYSKAFDLLMLLVQHNGNDLAKEEILETIWPGQILEESNLTVNISAVRKALGEKASQPRYLVTIPGRGYRFVGNVQMRPEMTDQIVIESETISQITIENEADDSSPFAAVPGDSHAILENKTEAQRLLPAPVSRPASQKFLRKPRVLVALILIAAVVVIAGVFGVRWFRRTGVAVNGFQQIKLRQLTNDGAVINAAISPDGKFFAFTHTEKGKQSLRLGQTNGQPPIELRPAGDLPIRGLEFAPDGSSVYYVIPEPGRNVLYRVSVLGGVPAKVRENISAFFAIAPDGKRVAFMRGDSGKKTVGIFISNLDGSNERTITSVSTSRNLTQICLSWSPDGSMIAVGASPENNQSAQGIFLLPVDGGELKPLSGPLWRRVDRVAWLKDGSGILAIAIAPGGEEDRQIWLTAYPGAETRRITNDLFSYDIGLSITTDSNNLLTTEHQQINNIWLAPAHDLTKARQLTFGAINRGDGLTGLDWTPSGKIVYTSANGKSQTLWIMDADGSNARQLTSPGPVDTQLSVTADGRFIIFCSNRSGASEIWRINIDGSDLKQLTTCGKNLEPSVAPDGKWIVYRSTCDNVGALWRVSIDGGEPTRLTDKPVNWPWISPDSKSVAVEYVIEPGKSKLAIIPIEGGPPTNLFDCPPSANFRYGIKWAFDGKAVTYRDWIRGLWRQPLDGGQPQRIEGLPDEKIYPYGWSRDGKLFAFTRGVEIRDVVLISNSK